MVLLVLEWEDERRELSLSPGAYQLGRGDDADIPVAHGSLSRSHARISVTNDAVTVEDLGSKNGTFVNGRRVTAPCSLETNVELKLGDVVFRLRWSGLNNGADRIKTSLGRSRTQTGTWTGTQLSLMTAPRTRLVVASSPDGEAVGREWMLDGRIIELGRGANGDGIADPRMSRRHIRITRLKGEDWIEDLGSANGTLVDGEPLGAAALLRPQSIIRVGSSFLVVDAPAPIVDLPARPDANGSEVTEVVGVSIAAEQLRRSIATVGAAEGPVLILGETGVGKEVTANALHRLGDGNGRLVPVNCASLTESLVSDELFGHYKGAFTGADHDREGYFQQASGGILFLDEVGELPPAVQAKLLRVLQDGVVQPLGKGPSVKTNARIVAATNADLNEGGFRSDLLARLQGWCIRIPPLRERRADILPLWDHVVSSFLGRPAPSRSLSFDEILLNYAWPKNVRELQKLAERVAQLLPSGGRFGPELLADEMRAVASTHREVRGEAGRGSPSKGRIIRALRATNGNVKNAAERNGWHRTQLYRWCQRLEIEPGDYRADGRPDPGDDDSAS